MAEPTYEQALKEAYDRGLLPDDMVKAYEEAQSRGIIAGLDTSPIELPKVKRMVGGKDPMEIEVDAPGAKIARKGIDVETGAPMGGRTKTGFAQNEAFSVEALEKSLSNYYDEPIKVRKGEYGFEFVNPETNRRTLVDESKLTLTDITEGIGPAAPVIGAVAGTLAGMTVGLPNLGAGAGAGVGEAFKRSIGHWLGVREQGLGDEARGVAMVSTIEGLASKFGETVARMGGKIRRFFTPEVVSPDDAAKLTVAMQQDQDIANEIAARTGRPFQPFSGQLAKDPQMLGHQSSLANDPETAIRFRQQQIQNESTLEAFWDQLNPAPEVPDNVVGRSIKLEARDQTKPRIDAARDSVERAKEDLARMTSELPKGENSNIVSEATAAAAQARKVIKQEEDRLWNAYKDQIGLNPDTDLSNIKVPVSGELKTTLNRLKAEAKAAVDPEDAAGKFRLAPNAFNDTKKTVLNPVTGRTSTETIKAEVDLWQLQRYIGSLKRRQRLARAGEVATDPTGRDVERMITAATKQRNEYLRANYPDLIEPINEAEMMTATRANLFDKGLVSQLLRKEGGEWTITDSQLVGGVIGTGDKEAMEHLVSAFSYHPAGIPTLQRAFLKYYRNEVVEDGVPKGALHRRFVSNHEDAINVLFPNDKRIMQLGEFEKQVTKKIERFKAFESNMKRVFRNRIQDISPEQIATKVFTDKFDIKDVSYLMQLARNAGVDDLYSAAIRNQVRTRFYSETSGISVDPLAKFIAKNEEKLVGSLGGRYVKDMKLLLEALKTIRTSESGIATTRRPQLLTTIAEGISRATFARPLSREGVALTKGIGFYERAKTRAWARIVENPDVLREIIANQNIDIATETGARILAMSEADHLYNMAAETFTYENLEEMNQ